ncbi:hypothetical protein C9374_006312 [Naegleria lovaniensis]|uniref:EamA domain-containing protein n=1 Tax=Naegleria lovaniensis TaxID=51637 RepID=A0AA88GMK9_NAELO|nr:uncharacterized protein C9374_006312 [Naegleria lovaniensis]KAG2381323.1 hypothetical protein C9374_006312 [Naegleria lovaniensis]
MGILVFKTETFSWFDLMTLFFTVTGAVIIILASATRVTEDENGNPVAYQWKWWPDFSQIGRGFKWPNDFIGMIIALLSSFFFSMKLNAVNKLAPSKTGEEKPSMNVHPSSYSMSKEGYEASSALVVNGSEDVVFAVDPSKSSSSLSTLPVLPSSPSLREKVLMVETQSSMALVSAQSNGELYHEDSVLMETQSQASDESAHSGASIEAPLLSSRYRVALHDSETATTKETLEDPKSIEPQQSREEENYVAPEISPEDLFYIQKYLLVLWPIIPMCLYEDWTVFTRYNTVRWLMFIWFMIMNRLVAAVLELWCAKEIGSSNYSIMFPIRIVIGLILSSVVLGEWIDNLVSILGCLIVVAAITAFSIKKHSK